MIMLIDLLVNPAMEAGIKTPENLENYDANLYPHWDVYTKLQLNAPMPSSNSHWENAKIVAVIPEDKIRKVTAHDVYELGFAVGSSQP